MTNGLKPPEELIAEVLNVPVDSLSDESGWGIHPHWDSLKQVAIIVELERNYGVEIDDVETYKSMKAIRELFVQQSHGVD